MNYQPRIGDFGVVRSNGIFARLIQVGTLSRWNHAFIYIGDGYIVEANPKGIQRSRLDKYNNVAWNRHEDLNHEERQQIVMFAINAIGKPYNFLMIGNIALRILGLKLLAKTKIMYRWAQASKGYICSELVAEAYESIGENLCDKDPDLVTPGDLAERLVYQ
jgi:uncharacterized protein YycO